MKAEELLKGIKCVMPGVDQTQIGGEGSDLITFEDRWVRTYDGRMSVSYPLDTGFRCSVPGKPLYDLLTKLGGGNIRLELEGDQFHLKGKGKHLKLQALERDLEEGIFDLSQVSFKPLPKDFLDGIGLCVFSMAKDPSMGLLTGMYIGGGMILASDNFRISHYEMESPLDGSVVIPYECIIYISRMEGIAQVALSPEQNPGWIHFGDEGGVILSSRLIQGEYNVKGLMDILGIERVGQYAFPDGTVDAVLRAGVLSDDSLGEQPFILIRRDGGNLVVTGEQKGVGEYEERIPWDADFPEENVMQMNPNFFMKILKITKEFSMDENGKFAIFTGPSFQHLEIAKVMD